MTRRRFETGLFLGALLIRLAHLALVHGGPLFRYLLIDSAFYDAVGRRLATGAGFPDGVFFMNILYGAFLGGIYTVAGAGEGGRLAALALQAGLGAASAVMLARIGERLLGPREGRIAAVVLALYGPAIFYDAALLTPSLLLFLTTASLLLALRAADGCGRSLAALGVVLGLLVLGRANNALLLPGYAVLLYRRGVPGRRLAALAALAVVVVLPVTLRNAAVSGEFVPVTANGGMALWAGNHPAATGIYSEPDFLSNPVPESEAEDYRAEASRRAGRELTLAESSGFWAAATRDRWLEDPGAAVRLFARKLRLWIAATESQTNLSYYFAMEFSTVLAVFRLHFGWILPFAVLGFPAVRRLAFAAVPIAVSLLTCLVFYMSSEYRHPVVPAVLLFSAAGAVRLVDAVRGRAPAARRVALFAALAVLAVLVNFRDPLLERLHSRRVDHYNFGTLAKSAGRPGEAERFFRASIAIDGEWAPSRQGLSEVLREMGRVREAAEEKALADRLAGVPMDSIAAGMARANDAFRAGNYVEALQLFAVLAAMSPEAAPSALNNAGLCAMNLRQPAAADSLFRAAAERDPTYASPVIHRGRLALAVGDTAAAVTHAEAALRIAPQDGRARRLLARARGESGGGP